VAADPEMTPAALLLARMREYGGGVLDFTGHLSRAHHAYFDSLTLPPERHRFFAREAVDSHERRQALEEADDRPFEQFLEDYFAQQE
jgi:glutamate--cysteine ligase